jgi:hypothetical protein
MTYINTTTGEYPVTERQIKEANPNVSFPKPFVPTSEYKLVFSAPKPEHTAIIQTAREVTPILTDKGHYEQQWEVVDTFSDYTDEEGVLHTKAEQEAAAQLAAFKATVPTAVSMRQARLALLGTNKLADVDAAIAAMPSPQKEAAQIEWEYATEVKIDSELVLGLITALGLTEQETDELFIQAASL